MIVAGTGFAPWLGVFETVRVIQGRPLFVAEHFAELRRAARALGLQTKMEIDPAAAAAELGLRTGRWRWLVTAQGSQTFFTEEPAASGEPLDLSVARVRVGSRNWDARFKTVSYLTHVQAQEEAPTTEAILLNESLQVASAACANLFWRRGGRLFTPAHEAGCRRGVVRGFVLQRREVQEGYYGLNDCLSADEIFLTSSMKGIISVQLAESRVLNDFAAADELRAEYEAAVARQTKPQSAP